MRADRLVAVLLLMQTRGRVTAAEIATELEVSVATARRDLEALSAAGVPVYPQTGRGGGWSLVGGARTDLSGLTAHEARALFLLLGTSPTLSSSAKAALRKVIRALPETFRADAVAASEAVVIDPARWGQVDRARPALLEVLQDAVVGRRQVLLTYTGRTGERTERTVHPLGLIDKDDVWYLIAGTDRGERTFRVDRVVGVMLTEQPARRPPDFDLSAAWERVVGEVEQRRSGLTATLTIEERFLGVLRDQFGRHCDVRGRAGRGRLRVVVSAPTPLNIAQQLAGWGALVDVEDCPPVQEELARLGAELVQRYPGPSVPAPTIPSDGTADGAGPSASPGAVSASPAQIR